MKLTSSAMMVRLGFSHDAADNIFNGQGTVSIDEWWNLDNDYVRKLLWNV